MMFNDKRDREEREIREERRRAEAEARETQRQLEADRREAQRQREFLLLLSTLMGNKTNSASILFII